MHLCDLYADPEWVDKMSKIMDKMRKEQEPHQTHDMLDNTKNAEIDCTEHIFGANISATSTEPGNTPEDADFGQLPSTPEISTEESTDTPSGITQEQNTACEQTARETNTNNKRPPTYLLVLLQKHLSTPYKWQKLLFFPS